MREPTGSCASAWKVSIRREKAKTIALLARTRGLPQNGNFIGTEFNKKNKNKNLKKGNEVFGEGGDSETSKGAPDGRCRGRATMF